MREIKFRAWDKLTGELINPEFYILGETTVFNMFEAWIHDVYDTPPKRYDNVLAYLNDIEIEQFTGLHDKNGKDIYEGDIIYFGYGIPTVSVYAPVIWQIDQWVVLTKGHKPSEAALGSLANYVGCNHCGASPILFEPSDYNPAVPVCNNCHHDPFEDDRFQNSRYPLLDYPHGIDYKAILTKYIETLIEEDGDLMFEYFNGTPEEKAELERIAEHWRKK